MNNRDNIQPKLNTEYIYTYDIMWTSDIVESIPIKPGTIVNNVKRVTGNDFKIEFTIVGDTKKCYCNYEWAFIKNTKANRKKYEELKMITEMIEKMQWFSVAKLNKIETLYPKQEERKLTKEERKTINDFFLAYSKKDE